MQWIAENCTKIISVLEFSYPWTSPRIYGLLKLPGKKNNAFGRGKYIHPVTLRISIIQTLKLYPSSRKVTVTCS